MDINERVFKVVSQILEVPMEDINEDSSPDSIENWDSLRHMNLILGLEEEFGIEFTDEQIVEMLNVGLIILEVQTMLDMSRRATSK